MATYYDVNQMFELKIVKKKNEKLDDEPPNHQNLPMALLTKLEMSFSQSWYNLREFLLIMQSLSNFA